MNIIVMLTPVVVWVIALLVTAFVLYLVVRKAVRDGISDVLGKND